ECIISKKKVHGFIKRCCWAVGLEDDHGPMLADVLVAADYRGHYSHGLKNLDKYLSDVTNRFVAKKGVPRIVKQTQATALVDGNNLLGPVVGNYCMDLAIEKAKQSGIGWVSVSGSNHFGMASWYGIRAVDKGFIGMAFTNTGAGMAPTRAIQNALGTKPICIAAPAKDGDSFVLDMATTTVAFGKVRLFHLMLFKMFKDIIHILNSKTYLFC
ncbi:uncharacterized oxidoreductase YjmC-like, partial [Ruditapes philippinarum]|uniref:uncharacterized oxidoreductase YjmC-like n=1 Tax=Ruditapes philippinarum TaxID=129788 RepID=UPI00295AE8AC